MTLSEHHLRELRDESAIPLEVIAERGYRTVTDPAELRCLGFEDYQCRVPAMLVPLRGTDGSNSRYALKPQHPRLRDGKPVKYDFQAGVKPIIDVPRRCLEALRDPTVPLLSTEGAKKADCAAGLGYCAINLWGVHNWYSNPEHGGFATIQPLPDWDAIPLDGRIVYLVFDSDSTRKPAVGLALRRLANFLTQRGALVSIVHLPDADDGSKQGLDDFVARSGAEAFAELVDTAEPWGSQGMVRKLEAEVRQLKQERSAIFEVLHNPRLSATERIVGVSVVCSANSRLSRGQDAPLRVTIDAPKHPDDPDDPERVGLAAEIGLSKNTVGRALDVVFAEDAPLVKETVYEQNDHGQLRARVQLTPRCSGGVPGMLWALARYDPKKTEQHGGARAAKHGVHCEHCPAGTPLRTVCTACGTVVDERPNPGPEHPEHQLGVPGAETAVASPSHVRNRTNLVIRPSRGGEMASRDRARGPAPVSARSPSGANGCRTCGDALNASELAAGFGLHFDCLSTDELARGETARFSRG